MIHKAEHLNTEILLPPGFLDPEKASDVLRLCLEEFRWFKPIRYYAGWTQPTKLPKGDALAFLLQQYEEGEWVQAISSGDRHVLYLRPDRRGRRSHLGTISIAMPMEVARDEAWRAGYVDQIVQLMQLVGSPYAWAGLDFDESRKNEYWSDGTLIMRVKRLDQGLIGLFWRNFFGPPLQRLFGERLVSLPPDTVSQVGGITVVQPYPLPEDALTPEGAAREKELIAKLGPECFYDHSREALPTRVPDLPPVDPL